MQTDRSEGASESHQQESTVDVREARTGLGVFATRAYSPGEIIGAVHGEVVHDSGYESDYCIHLDSMSSLEPSAPFRFLNHACEPNCDLAFDEEAYDEEAESEPALWIEALSAIEPGDELRIDYGWPASVAIPCQCGSPHCRGWVVARDEIDQLNMPRQNAS
ncbi:MAG: SET domain-containing protein-lysine N-methyltransferase [Pirellulales bacterium]|nr:SET domain-containing protein-lysine N-methyltransferase [Pirellulales bacterium]